MFPKKLTRQVICEPDKPIVEVEGGRLRGLIVEDTYIFRGIRYAEAERFHLPHKPASWEGVKDAIIFGNSAPEMSTGIAHDAYNVPHYYYPQDEDCQYLNIWTQSLDRNAKKPVMVWIHGGGFNTGSGVELYAYDGEELSKRGDVVVVSLNHRLNCLGYLDLSAYGEEYRYSGNAGTADLVAALEWVRDNIAAFGGDPGNVTIFGQSGGGGKVRVLLQTPKADGLYHKAIIESGIHFDGDYTTEVAQYVAAGTLSYLGIDPSEVKKIETVPYYKLARAATKAFADAKKQFPDNDFRWMSVLDGDYYLGQSMKRGFRPETANIPMIVGSNFGESETNYNHTLAEGSKNSWDDALVRKLMKETYGAIAEDVAEQFSQAYPKRNSADALFLDRNHRPGVRHFINLRSKQASAPVWNYLFTLELPVNGGTTAWHNAEEQYVFHNACYIEASYIPGVTEELQDIMCDAWISFARTGDPNHVKMPVWKPVTPDHFETMIFDRKCEMRYDHDGKLYALLPIGRRPVARRRSASVLGGGPRQSL